MKNISILFWQKQQENGDTKGEVIDWKKRKSGDLRTAYYLHAASLR